MLRFFCLATFLIASPLFAMESTFTFEGSNSGFDNNCQQADISKTKPEFSGDLKFSLLLDNAPVAEDGSYFYPVQLKGTVYTKPNYRATGNTGEDGKPLYDKSEGNWDNLTQKKLESDKYTGERPHNSRPDDVYHCITIYFGGTGGVDLSNATFKLDFGQAKREREDGSLADVDAADEGPDGFQRQFDLKFLAASNAMVDGEYRMRVQIGHGEQEAVSQNSNSLYMNHEALIPEGGGNSSAALPKMSLGGGNLETQDTKAYEDGIGARRAQFKAEIEAQRKAAWEAGKEEREKEAARLAEIKTEQERKEREAKLRQKEEEAIAAEELRQTQLDNQKSNPQAYQDYSERYQKVYELDDKRRQLYAEQKEFRKPWGREGKKRKQYYEYKDRFGDIQISDSQLYQKQLAERKADPRGFERFKTLHDEKQQAREISRTYTAERSHLLKEQKKLEEELKESTATFGEPENRHVSQLYEKQVVFTTDHQVTYSEEDQKQYDAGLDERRKKHYDQIGKERFAKFKEDQKQRQLEEERKQKEKEEKRAAYKKEQEKKRIEEQKRYEAEAPERAKEAEQRAAIQAENRNKQPRLFNTYKKDAQTYQTDRKAYLELRDKVKELKSQKSKAWTGYDYYNKLYGKLDAKESDLTQAQIAERRADPRAYQKFQERAARANELEQRYESEKARLEELRNTARASRKKYNEGKKKFGSLK